MFSYTDNVYIYAYTIFRKESTKILVNNIFNNITCDLFRRFFIISYLTSNHYIINYALTYCST